MDEQNTNIINDAAETVATTVAEASNGKSGVGKIIAVGVGLICLAGGIVIGKVTGKGKKAKPAKKSKKKARRRDDDDEVIDVDDYEEVDEEDEKPKKNKAKKSKDEEADEE